MLHDLFPLGTQHYLAGGVIIGIGVSLVFVLTGAVSGMSTVFSSTWSYFVQAPFFQQPRFVESRGWRLALALGLVAGAFVWWLAVGPPGGVTTGVPLWRLLLGGLFVGFGARMSNGCTSGHGICGLASLKWPSLVAVITFLTTAMLVANLWPVASN
jgi:uncharacterized protein